MRKYPNEPFSIYQNRNPSIWKLKDAVSISYLVSNDKNGG